MKQGASGFPPCWEYSVTTDGNQNVQTRMGKLGSIKKNGELEYLCLCGAFISRLPGEDIEEIALWVEGHRRHLHERVMRLIPNVS